MNTKHHVVIAGTGRSGTTFLVELLTNLGLDTGFTPQDLRTKKFEVARAGLETNILKENCPYVVKDPSFHKIAKEVFESDTYVIDHLIIPVRDLEAAVSSRNLVQKESLSQLSLWERCKRIIKRKRVPGGLLKRKPLQSQEEMLLYGFYELMLHAAVKSTPVTLIQYPKMLKDSDYLYQKLQPVLNGMSPEAFASVFNATVNLKLSHQFNANDK